MLRAYRRQLAMSQEELAEAAGLSVRSIRKIEVGHTESPRPATKRLLADALRLTGAERDRFVRAAGSGPAVPDTTAPRQLPADISGFTGRALHLRELDAVLPGETSRPPTVVISAIGGTAGVGKTALAVHWAHRAADRFPDGQLYLNLRGFANARPLAPLVALARLMHAFGVPGDRIPEDLDMASSMYRGVVAGKKMLLVLDNAVSAEQVRPLLPSGSGAAVVVTSRDQLRGLTAREGARRLDLGVLSQRESVALLRLALGAERAGSDPAAVSELAQLCGGLPLALRIAAANLASRPRQPIADYVTMLRDGDRLAVLSVPSDPDSAVLASFHLSYGGLPDPAKRMFRLLGLVPGPDVSAETAAALADTSLTEAGHLLDLLVSAHLLEEQTYRRYAFHDLLRRYAESRAGTDEPDRAGAVHRLYDSYLSTVDAAARLLYPEKTRLTISWSRSGASGPTPSRTFQTPEQALTWLGEELAGLVAAVTRPRQDDLRRKVYLLADALRGYFWLNRSVEEWIAVANAALTAAQADGNLSAVAAAWLSLGDAHQARGSYRQAIELYRRAHETGRGTAGPDEIQFSALNNLGCLYMRSGQLREARDCFDELLAFVLHEELPGSEVLALGNLGSVLRAMGELDRAADLFVRSLAVSRQVHSPASQRRGVPKTLEGNALCELGELRHAQGRLDQARELLTLALSVFRELGDRFGEARALVRLAAVDRDSGEPSTHLVDRALAVAHELADPDLEADAHNVLGTIHDRHGRHRVAIVHHRQALELASNAELRELEVEALIGLGDAHLHAGEHAKAHGYLAQAVTIASRHGYRLLTDRATSALSRSERPR